MKISRREFVKTTAAAVTAAAIVPSIGCTAISSPFDAKGLPTKILGMTGVRVPRMAVGLGSRWMGETNDDIALEILEYALNNGLYYWDTAANYGNEQISSEERIGRLLKNRRKEVFLVTKVEEREADKAKESIERSLKRLQTDYIDLLHVHSIASTEDAESLGNKGKVLEVMHQYRDEGIVKHIGFTGHAVAEGMKRAAELYDFEAMMIALNHNVTETDEKFEEYAVPFAAKKGLGVIAMKVIRPRETVEGLDPHDLIRYALSLDHFSVVNIGTDKMEVLKENLDLIRNFQPLPDSRMEEIRLALEPFYHHKNLAWMKPGYIDGIA
jgi:aryl-alcohol dehydrogenase-like predicted oxidoreductase